MSLPDLLCLYGTELFYKARFLGASAVFIHPCTGGRTAEHALGFVGLSHMGNVCLTWAVCVTQAVCCTQAVYVPHGQYVPHSVFHMGSVSHTGSMSHGQCVSHGHCIPHRQDVSHGQCVQHGQCVPHRQCVLHGQCVSHVGSVSHTGSVSHGQCVSHVGSVSHTDCGFHMVSVCPTHAVCAPHGQLTVCDKPRQCSLQDWWVCGWQRSVCCQKMVIFLWRCKCHIWLSDGGYGEVQVHSLNMVLLWSELWLNSLSFA